MKRIWAVLRGIDIPPLVVGLARGVLEAAVMGGLVELLVLFGQTEWADSWWAVAVIYGVRQAESWADHIDPEKTRKPTA